MDQKKQMEAAIYAACFAAAVALGPNIKNLSWFGANNTVPRKVAA